MLTHAHPLLHTYPKARTEQRAMGCQGVFVMRLHDPSLHSRQELQGRDRHSSGPKPPLSAKVPLALVAALTGRGECGRAGGCRLGRWITGLPASAYRNFLGDLPLWASVSPSVH